MHRNLIILVVSADEPVSMKIQGTYTVKVSVVHM